jgi:hypothetical protein
VREKQNDSIETCSSEGSACEWGWRLADIHDWFEQLLAALGMEHWIGDPAEIKSKRVKKQKTDRRDALLLLRLSREDNFPRIWYRVQRIVIFGNCFGIATG